MNKIALQKYGFSPDFIEEKILNDEKFCLIYDFHRLVKVQKFQDMTVVILNQLDGWVKN